MAQHIDDFTAARTALHATISVLDRLVANPADAQALAAARQIISENQGRHHADRRLDPAAKGKVFPLLQL